MIIDRLYSFIHSFIIVFLVFFSFLFKVMNESKFLFLGCDAITKIVEISRLCAEQILSRQFSGG